MYCIDTKSESAYNEKWWLLYVGIITIDALKCEGMTRGGI